MQIQRACAGIALANVDLVHSGLSVKIKGGACPDGIPVALCPNQFDLKPMAIDGGVVAQKCKPGLGVGIGGGNDHVHVPVPVQIAHGQSKV